MKKQFLLKVEDTFSITGRGLVVVPLLELIPQGFRPFEDSVIIKRPDGSEIELSARFNVSHFKMQEGGKWAIAILLPVDSKQLVPIDSELWVSESAFDTLKQKTA